MTRIAYLASALGLVLSTAACRSDDDPPGGPDGGGGSDGPPVAGEVTIQEVQNDAMASGTAIELKGVVVVAIDAFGNRTGDLFVSEPEGGPFSGVKVFGASLDQIATLQPGDLVDITGAKKHEGCNMEAPCGTVVFSDGHSITEVMPVSQGSMQITKVGTGTVPTPTVVDAKAIAALPSRTERDAEWEKYEGVLIKVTNARQLSEVATFGRDPGPDSNEFRATGFARVQSVLTELPNTAVAGTCYDSITGVGDYFFNYIVAPRTAADLVTGGTGCNPMVESVVALQTATAIPEIAKLTNVIVTARDDVGGAKGFWVQDAAQGAANNGVYVFIGGSNSSPATLNPALVVGARVDIVGGVDEYDFAPQGQTATGDTVTQLANPLISNIVAPTAQPTPATTASVATLASIGAAGEPWEGVLVQVGPVKVTAITMNFGQVTFTDNNGNSIIMDDEAQRFGGTGEPPVPTMGSCYNVTGVMHVQVNADIRTINPRGAADIVATTGCN